MESDQIGDENRSEEISQGRIYAMKMEEVRLSEQLSRIPFGRKVEYVYSHFDKQEKWKKSDLTTTKSTAKSTNFRETGNKLFREGRDNEALRLYTESLAAAFPDSVEISLAFANRSAALYRLKNYFASLQDVNRSLTEHCPESIRSKLLQRRESCLKKIEEENCIKTKLMGDFKVQQVEDKSHNFLEQNLQFVKCDPSETEPMDQLCSLPVIENKNNILPNTNAKVQLAFSSTYGNHMTSCQDINPGEILTYEKAFSSILDRNFRLTNCSHCLVRNDAPIPCKGCSLALFCGEKCRIGAYNSYHRIECEIANLLQEATDEFPYHDGLPLRTLLIGSEQGKNFQQLMVNPELSKVMRNEYRSVNEKMVQPDYISICNLHRDIDTLPEMTVLGLSMKSACFLHWLKQTSFFSREYSRVLTEEDVFAGTLILNHFLTLVFNAFSVTESVIPVVDDRKAANYTTGTCLYALCSRFNHSCDPNADFYSNKDYLIIYSHRPILAGEQILISYETHYHSVPLLKRQTSLSQYGFLCQCLACIQDWPLYDDLPHKPTLLSTIDTINMSMMRLYNKYEKLWSDDTMLNVAEELLQFLFEFSSIISENFKTPLQLQVVCQNSIEKLLSTKGNFYIDCYDVRRRVIILMEYIATKTSAERLSGWIRDFLRFLSAESVS